MALCDKTGVFASERPLPDKVEEHVGHALGRGHDGALGLVEGAGVVLDVANLPHQSGDPPVGKESGEGREGEGGEHCDGSL